MESPASGKMRSVIRFSRQETCLLQIFTGRFVKFTELLPCVKAKHVNGSETSKLVASLSTGKFWIPPPPYSLDLKPSDFYLFCYLKNHLDINRYNNNEVVKIAVTSFYKSRRRVSLKRIFKIQL